MSNKKTQLMDENTFLELVQDVPGADMYLEELASGKKPDEIIKDALTTTVILKSKVLKELTTEQLMASFFFWDAVYQRMLRSVFATSMIWNILLNSFMRFLDVYSTIYAVAAESKENEARAKLIEEFMKMMRRAERRITRLAKELSPTTQLILPQLQQGGGRHDGSKNKKN